MNFVITLLLLCTTTYAQKQKDEFSQYWRINSMPNITGVSEHGNCICIPGKVICGHKPQSPQELVNAFSGIPCKKVEDIPDSDQNYYQCYNEKKDCSQDLMKKLNQEFGCEASITKTFPLEDPSDKKLGNLIEFKSPNCRISHLARKLPCESGFESKYLRPDQKDYKICVKSTGASAPAGGINPTGAAGK